MSDLQSNAENLAGKTIGAFHIEAEIGRSQWGKVYRAIQTTVNRTVALKVVSPEHAAVAGAIESFLAGSQDAAQIVHPLICAVYEAGRADGLFVCAMELMDGPPLAEFLRGDAGVNEPHLLSTVAHVAEALDYLWLRGVAHQVPQAKNILVNAVG